MRGTQAQGSMIHGPLEFGRATRITDHRGAYAHHRDISDRGQDPRSEGPRTCAAGQFHSRPLPEHLRPWLVMQVIPSTDWESCSLHCSVISLPCCRVRNLTAQRASGLNKPNRDRAEQITHAAGIGSIFQAAASLCRHNATPPKSKPAADGTPRPPAVWCHVVPNFPDSGLSLNHLQNSLFNSS
jgi:hypothetical protein